MLIDYRVAVSLGHNHLTTRHFDHCLLNRLQILQAVGEHRTVKNKIQLMYNTVCSFRTSFTTFFLSCLFPRSYCQGSNIRCNLSIVPLDVRLHYIKSSCENPTFMFTGNTPLPLIFTKENDMRKWILSAVRSFFLNDCTIVGFIVLSATATVTQEFHQVPPNT